MYMDIRFSKIALISVILISLSAAAAAEWSFEPNEHNLEDISNDTNAVYTADLVEQSTEEHLSPSDIANFTEEDGGSEDSNTYVIYEYERLNSTSGDPITVNRTLSYHHGFDTWYAEFDTNYTEMNELTFKARGDSEVSGHESSGGEVVEVMDAAVSEIGVELINTDLEYSLADDQIKADREFKADVQVTNITSGEYLGSQDEQEVNVQVYFHNLDEEEDRDALDNYNEEENYHHNAEVSTPPETGEDYIFRIVAESNGEVGTQSMIVETAPAINGEIHYLQGENNCEDETIISACEPESDLETEFNIISASAEAVNLTLYGYNRTDGSAVELERKEMDETEANEEALQTFESDITVPDINTSKYETHLDLEYHAWNQDRAFIENRTITLEQFDIEDRSNPTALKDRTHEIRLLIGKHFSLDAYNLSRFNDLQVNLTGPGDDFHENYSHSDFEFSESENLIVNEIVIPENEESGTYSLDVSATDIYDHTVTATSGLRVVSVNATFTAEEEVDEQYNSLGTFTESIELENLGDTEKTIETYTDLEIVDITDSFTISSDETYDAEFDVNISSPGVHEGEIVFTDPETEYNQTTEVTINGPECSITDEDLCISDESVHIHASTPEPATGSVTVTNLGDEALDLETSLSGNATSRLSVEENVTVEQSETLDIVFESDQPGSYESTLTLSGEEAEGNVDISAEADFDETESSISLTPSTVDIGSVPEGESHTEEITVENDGDITVNDIEAESEEFDIDVGPFSLAQGEEYSFDFTVEDPQSATVTFTGQASGDNVTADLTVQGEVLEDYSQRADDLEGDIGDLRVSTNDPGLETQLTEVSTMIDQIKSQWDSGNYEEARSTYQQAESELQNIESQIDSQQTDSGADNGEDTGTGGDSDEGGLPILPVLGILFALILIGGFVFYESYIPEEGDPLYGVLGE